MLGIFDSGIGGLTVVRELLRRHPRASFEYLGDTARSPYGTKGRETIVRYALEDAAFLAKQGATAFIVACNTVSAYALNALRVAYPAFPIFDVVGPAVSAAATQSLKRVGVIGTRATIASGVYEAKLRAARPDLEIFSAACPLFVPLVEEGWLEDGVTREVVARYLAPLKAQEVDTLILGCTHYPLLQTMIAEEMGSGVTIVDSPTALMNKIDAHYEELLDARRIFEGSGHPSYHFTDIQPTTETLATRWLGRSVRAERAEI